MANKHDHLLDHIRDRRNWDPHSRLVLGTNPKRLGLLYIKPPGSWREVATLITGLMSDIAWFPDANFAFLPESQPVWDALRPAGLGSPEEGSTIVTDVAEAEWTEWLEDPWHHHERAGAIKSALKDQTWARRFRLEREHPFLTAYVGYIHILGFRRLLASPLWGGLTAFGKRAEEKTETMNELHRSLGPRAQDLARKGRREYEKRGSVNVRDEQQCLLAILYALLKRRPAAILTADPDYLEIFFKAQWFLDTHYRAWLAARLIHEGRYGEPAGTLENTEGYFQGPVTLYRRPTENLREVLPATAEMAPVFLVYVAPDNQLHLMGFPFELPMLEMLETRSRTNGRCTDLFNDANIHVDLGPLKPSLNGNYLGVGRDAVWRFQAKGGVDLSIGRMDLMHSISCCERFTLLAAPRTPG